MRQASRRKFHYVYRIVRDDGWYYIGMHSTDDLEDGYFGSGSDLWRSINRHGRDKHSKEILEILPDRISLKQREREIIGESWKDDPICLNRMPGGSGGWEALNRGDEAHIERCSKNGKLMGSKILESLRSDPGFIQRNSKRRRRLSKNLNFTKKTQDPRKFKWRF